MGKLAHVVKDDLTVGAEHLGQSLHEGQQWAHAGIERLLGHTQPPGDGGSRIPQGGDAALEASCIASPAACQKEWRSYPV
jgi:hypothetical protein